MKSVSFALLLALTWILTPLEASAKDSPGSRFDGMSAIEIEIAAALQNPTAHAWKQQPAVDTPQTGGSPVQFLRFDLVEVKGRPEHQGELPIQGQPKPGPGAGFAQMSVPVQTAQFRLETEAGGLIGYIDLQSPEATPAGLDFLGDLTIPDQPFRVAAAGTDLEGQPFDVAWEQTITPQHLEVRFDPETLVVGSGPTQLGAMVTNNGPAGTFAIDVATNLGLDVSSNFTELELAEGAAVPIVVTVLVPAISSGVLEIVITATATSVTDSQITNFGMAQARTERFEKIFWDSLE